MASLTEDIEYLVSTFEGNPAYPQNGPLASAIRRLVQNHHKEAGSWYVDLPCPDCGMYNVTGLSLVLEGFGHNHTRYYCRSWIKPKHGPGSGVPCGWEGWTVP